MTEGRGSGRRRRRADERGINESDEADEMLVEEGKRS